MDTGPSQCDDSVGQQWSRHEVQLSGAGHEDGAHATMRVPLAWRILTYDKGRTALALIGIFLAILLVFIELGFFYAVPRGGLLLYDNMRFDLLLVSDQYEYQAQPGAFPSSRPDPIRASPGV